LKQRFGLKNVLKLGFIGLGAVRAWGTWKWQRQGKAGFSPWFVQIWNLTGWPGWERWSKKLGNRQSKTASENRH
jgi:hypothetical protein